MTVEHARSDDTADRDARALAAVWALHRPEQWDGYGQVCAECGTPWPCVTARAIEEATQP